MKNNEKLWRSFKSDLKKAYYKPFKGNKRWWQCGDSRVDQTSGGCWLNIEKKDETAEQARRNAENWSKQMLNHTSGRESYARSKAQYAEMQENFKGLVEDECPDDLETRRRA